MNIHININSKGQLATATDLDKFKELKGYAFKPSVTSIDITAKTVSISKALFGKIKPLVGLGAASPHVVSSKEFFDPNFEQVKGIIYLTIENDSLKEISVTK